MRAGLLTSTAICFAITYNILKLIKLIRSHKLDSRPDNTR